METYRIEYGYLPQQEFKAIVRQIKKGDLAIFPTDSVYTLACALSAKDSIKRLCKLVGKKSEQAQLSIICNDFSMISDFTVHFSTSNFRSMKAALPGPYTFILNADKNQTKHWENKRKTIGVRIPNQDFLLELIGQIGEPLICSSLHSEDELKSYFTEPENIEQQYKNTIDLFVEDGAGGTEPSTVVDCTGDYPELIREGMGTRPL